MQNFAQVPIFSDVAFPFFYPVLTASSNTNSVTISTANGTNKGYITLIDDCYFAHMAWGVWTNYDNAGGLAETAAVTATVLAGPPSTPNNFTVSIARGQNNTFSNTPLTQAELCSSGQFSGKQMPYPVIYGPATTFDFSFTDTTGLYLLTSGDVAIPLQIQLWMIGYKIPETTWDKFLEYFPGLGAEYK